jgi:myosin-light-chain kinase
MLTEYLPGGELFRYISSKKYKLTEAKCQIFAKQVLLAIEFMHSKRIIHLDLKPENILLVNNLMDDPDNSSLSEALKIIDFGLARNLGIRNKIPINMCGTLEFISPEVMRCSHASFASDMWSVGVIIYMMISGGISPFWSGTEYGTQYHIHRAQLARGGYKHASFKNVSKTSIDCVSKLLILEPKSRLSAKECLAHKWFGSVSEQTTLKKLETAWLRKYLARRRWKRWFITIKAINRMIKIGESVSNGRRSSANAENTTAHNPGLLPSYRTDIKPQRVAQHASPKQSTEDKTPKQHNNPIIDANGLSDRLKQLMMQNYGDLGL